MENIVQTRCSKLKENAAKDFVYMSYEGPKKKQKTQKEPNELNKTVSENIKGLLRDKEQDKVDHKYEQEREMKKVRYEVIKFGMSGFEKAKARQAKVSLAISLGAKAPRNKNLNYKQLKDERKKKKEESKKTEEESGLEKSLLKHKLKKKKPKKEASGILGVYGKVQKGEQSTRSKR